MPAPSANVAWLWHREVKRTGYTPGLQIGAAADAGWAG